LNQPDPHETREQSNYRRIISKHLRKAGFDGAEEVIAHPNRLLASNDPVLRRLGYVLLVSREKGDTTRPLGYYARIAIHDTAIGPDWDGGGDGNPHGTPDTAASAPAKSHRLLQSRQRRRLERFLAVGSNATIFAAGVIAAVAGVIAVLPPGPQKWVQEWAFPDNKTVVVVSNDELNARYIRSIVASRGFDTAWLTFDQFKEAAFNKLPRVVVLADVPASDRKPSDVLHRYVMGHHVRIVAMGDQTIGYALRLIDTPGIGSVVTADSVVKADITDAADPRLVAAMGNSRSIAFRSQNIASDSALLDDGALALRGTIAVATGKSADGCRPRYVTVARQGPLVYWAYPAQLDQPFSAAAETLFGALVRVLHDDPWIIPTIPDAPALPGNDVQGKLTCVFPIQQISRSVRVRAGQGVRVRVSATEPVDVLLTTPATGYVIASRGAAPGKNATCIVYTFGEADNVSSGSDRPQEISIMIEHKYDKNDRSDKIITFKAHIDVREQSPNVYHAPPWPSDDCKADNIM
jgi:hypothetical protein